MFLLRRITNIILMSFRTCFGIAMLFPKDHATLKRVQGDKIFKKALAFTLAETLIVMGIIGVVAALTIPNLNSSTADKEKVAKLSKIYSNLQDAYGRATAVYGPVEEWFQGDTSVSAQTTRFAERMKDFLKVSKDCGTNQASNTTCFVGPSASGSAIDANAYAMVLADGASIAVSQISPNCSTSYTVDNSDNWCAYILVDLDGSKKGQNKGGYDQFRFIAGKNNGIVPEGAVNDIDASTDQNLRFNCFGANVSVTCAGWVIQNGNMDYLKVDNSGKCPNGKILSWSNTSCK